MTFLSNQFALHNLRMYNEFFIDTLANWSEDIQLDECKVSLLADFIIMDVVHNSQRYKIIQRHDHLGTGHFYELLFDYIAQLDQQEQVIFLTAVFATPVETFKNMPNVKIVYFGSDYLLQRNTYPCVTPVFDKQLSNKHWVSLTHGTRTHRVLAACFLLGLDLEVTGDLRISPHTVSNITSWHDIEPSDTSEIRSYFDTFAKGFQKFKEMKVYSGQSCHDPYEYIGPNNNSTNFELYLRSIYSTSTVELINETIFFGTDGIITEKYLNSVYGCNFPIILSVPNAVEHLRSVGFDMFDDVVDHAYDKISDPMLRLTTAITDNMRLLQDTSFAFDAWQQCLPRFKSNIEFAKHDLYVTQQQAIINNLNQIF